MRPLTVRRQRHVATVGLAGLAALLLLGVVPTGAATGPTADACQVLGAQYPGTGGSPNGTFAPAPTSNDPSSPRVTNGEVVQLFLQICPTPAFGQAFAQHGSSAFGLGESGNSWTGDLVVDFTFHWQSACPPAQAPSSECTFQENWDGWPSNGSTAGPTTEVAPSVCAGCPESPASATVVSLPEVGVGVVVGAAVVVVTLVAGRRRRHHPPSEIAPGAGSASDPAAAGRPGSGAP
jgi:hypothetical protein